MSTTDHMVPITEITDMDEAVLPVLRDYDTVIIGRYRLDLAGIGRLQVALDQAVEGIYDYQRRAAEDG